MVMIADEFIAKMAHEVNRTYCAMLGDDSQVSWEDAPEWQRTSAINGVTFHRANPDARAEDSHANWLKEKLADGWQYGPVKDVEKKEHPCCVEYHELPVEQQIKDSLFKSVVTALLTH
jgi:hypothetical protein